MLLGILYPFLLKKASKEFGNLQRQVEALTVSSRQRGMFDFFFYNCDFAEVLKDTCGSREKFGPL